jgi:two-component system response regulator PrrA
MRRVLGRILVIDDDAAINRVIVKLLERAGFSVLVQESPLGATQAIVNERIDAAVIDWNLPLVRGDDVIRLLATWDELKDLPVLLISGAAEETLERVRAELPGIAVLAKDQMGECLVKVLGQVISRGQTIRGLKPIDLAGQGEFASAPGARPRSPDLVAQLLKELAEAMRSTSATWSETTQGKVERTHALAQGLDLLAGRARLLALKEAGDLLQALSETLGALPDDRAVSPDERRAIEDGIAALSALPRSGDGSFTIPPEPLIGALRRARSERPSS